MDLIRRIHENSFIDDDYWPPESGAATSATVVAAASGVGIESIPMPTIPASSIAHDPFVKPNPWDKPKLPSLDAKSLHHPTSIGGTGSHMAAAEAAIYAAELAAEQAASVAAKTRIPK